MNWRPIPWPRLLVLIVFLAASNFASVAYADNFIPLSSDITPHYHPKDNLEAGLWLQLNKAEQTISQSPKRITDPALNQYVKHIVCRLTPTYCNDIRVYIVRMPYFNAMMAPNGMLIVWSGLLLRVGNESQLAAVLGHEIGHYLRRHSLDNFIEQRNTSNVSAFLSLGLAAVGAAPLASITNLMLTASIFAHSRQQEYEADKYGIQLMAQAGYQVNQAANLWDAVIAEDKASKENNDESHVPFFATHPPSKDRSQRLRHYASELVTTEKIRPSDQKKFTRILSPLWGTFLNDQILLNQPKRTQYLLNELVHKHTLLGTIHYYKGQMLQRRDNAEDAKREYLKALQYDDAPAEAHKELGLVYLKQRHYSQAKKQLEKYLSLMPNAKDKEMIQFYISMEQSK